MKGRVKRERKRNRKRGVEEWGKGVCISISFYYLLYFTLLYNTVTFESHALWFYYTYGFEDNQTSVFTKSTVNPFYTISFRSCPSLTKNSGFKTFNSQQEILENQDELVKTRIGVLPRKRCSMGLRMVVLWSYMLVWTKQWDWYYSCVQRACFSFLVFDWRWGHQSWERIISVANRVLSVAPYKYDRIKKTQDSQKP